MNKNNSSNDQTSVIIFANSEAFQSALKTLDSHDESHVIGENKAECSVRLDANDDSAFELLSGFEYTHVSDDKEFSFHSPIVSAK